MSCVECVRGDVARPVNFWLVNMFSFLKRNVVGKYIFVFLDAFNQLHVHEKIDFSNQETNSAIKLGIKLRVGGYFKESCWLGSESDNVHKNWKIVDDWDWGCGLADNSGNVLPVTDFALTLRLVKDHQNVDSIVKSLATVVYGPAPSKSYSAEKDEHNRLVETLKMNIAAREQDISHLVLEKTELGKAVEDLLKELQGRDKQVSCLLAREEELKRALLDKDDQFVALAGRCREDEKKIADLEERLHDVCYMRDCRATEMDLQAELFQAEIDTLNAAIDLERAETERLYKKMQSVQKFVEEKMLRSKFQQDLVAILD